MQTPDVLRERIASAAGRGGLAAYRGLSGPYDFGHFQVLIDYVQKDPSSSPTRLRLRVDQQVAKFPRRFVATPAAQRATEDWIARQAHAILARRAADNHGSVHVDAGGPAVLARTAVRLSAEVVELRLSFRVATETPLALTTAWERLIFSDIPTLAREALLFDSRTSDLLRQHVESVEDQAALRGELASRGWVAFLRDGLPIDAARKEDTTGRAASGFALAAPASLRATVRLANGEEAVGLAIPAGVTVVVGGVLGWQGALVDAIGAGIHDWAPGSDREMAVAEPTAWRVCPEPGRPIAATPLDWFIGPAAEEDSAPFASTAHAGRMESLMAGVVEAVEAGSRLLLLDEAECPAAFLAADSRVRSLVGEAAAGAGVAPYVDLARALYDNYGVSSIVATGSCGDFLEIADTILVAEGTELRDATASYARTGVGVAERDLTPLPPRAPDPGTISSQAGGKFGKISVRGLDTLVFGTAEIPTAELAGLVDSSQLRAMGDALDLAKRKTILDGTRTIPEVAQEVVARIERDGLEVISPHLGHHPGDYAGFRAIDLAALIARYPGLRVGEPGAVAVRPAPPGGDAHEPHAEGSGRRKRRSRRGKRADGPAGAHGADRHDEEEGSEPATSAPEPVVAPHEPTEGAPAKRSRSRGRGRSAKKAPAAATPPVVEEAKPAPPPPSEEKPAKPARTARRRGESRKTTAGEGSDASPVARPAESAPESPAETPAPSAARKRHTRRRPSAAVATETPPPAPAEPVEPAANGTAAAPRRRRRRKAPE